MNDPNDNLGIGADELRQFVERFERLNEEIAGLNDDKKDLLAEAKSRGFDTKALKVVVQRRAKDPSEREEFDAIVDLYEEALSRPPLPPPPPARAPARAREDKVQSTTMTMSYTDGSGNTVTTPPFTTDDLKKVNEAVKKTAAKGKAKKPESPPPPPADDLDPFGD